jgi:hypothetical protein
MMRAPPGAPLERVSKRKHQSRKRIVTSTPLAFVRTKRNPDSDVAPSTRSDETESDKVPEWKNIFHRRGRLRSALQDLKDKASSRSNKLPKFLGISSADEKEAKKDDLEKGKGREPTLQVERFLASPADEQNAGHSESTRVDLVNTKREKNLQISRIERKEDDRGKTVTKNSIEDPSTGSSVPLAIAPVAGGETPMAATTQSEPENQDEQVGLSPSAAAVDLSPTEALKEAQSEPNPSTAEALGQGQENNQNPPGADTFRGKDKLADITEERATIMEARGEVPAPVPGRPRRADTRRAPAARVPLGQLDEVLIKAYSLPNVFGQLPPLQLRRTLDQYFYTHLASTYERDMDQVVLRYTQNGSGIEPKIFMVDQLWLWVLNEGKSISELRSPAY